MLQFLVLVAILASLLGESEGVNYWRLAVTTQSTEAWEAYFYELYFYSLDYDNGNTPVPGTYSSNRGDPNPNINDGNVATNYMFRNDIGDYIQFECSSCSSISSIYLQQYNGHTGNRIWAMELQSGGTTGLSYDVVWPSFSTIAVTWTVYAPTAAPTIAPSQGPTSIPVRYLTQQFRIYGLQSDHFLSNDGALTQAMKMTIADALSIHSNRVYKIFLVNELNRNSEPKNIISLNVYFRADNTQFTVLGPEDTMQMRMLDEIQSGNFWTNFQAQAIVFSGVIPVDSKVLGNVRTVLVE